MICVVFVIFVYGAAKTRKKNNIANTIDWKQGKLWQHKQTATLFSFSISLNGILS